MLNVVILNVVALTKKRPLQYFNPAAQAEDVYQFYMDPRGEGRENQCRGSLEDSVWSIAVPIMNEVSATALTKHHPTSVHLSN
jgi:hypothetical protein